MSDIKAIKCTKFDRAGGAYSAADPLAVFKGAYF